MIDQILTPAGGWNVLTPNWDPTGYDLTRALKKVHVDYWKDALFTVTIRGDWLDAKKNAINVSLFVFYCLI